MESNPNTNLEQAISNKEIEVQKLTESSGKNYTWEIVVTIGVIIIAIIAAIFIWLWSVSFIQNKEIRAELNQCNQDVTTDQEENDANITKLNDCEEQSKEIQTTSLGTFTFDTRSFRNKVKRFIKVDSPQLNTSDLGVYPFNNALFKDDQDRNLLDKNQFPKKDKVDKLDYLYGFVFKPPPPYPNTSADFKTDTCSYWQVINRLKTDWSWELGYQTSSELDGTYGSAYYRVAHGVGDTDKIPDGGAFLNSGDVTDPDVNTGASCIAIGTICLFTITDNNGKTTQQEFTAPLYNFNITVYHPEDAQDTARAVIGYLTTLT